MLSFFRKNKKNRQTQPLSEPTGAINLHQQRKPQTENENLRNGARNEAENRAGFARTKARNQINHKLLREVHRQNFEGQKILPLKVRGVSDSLQRDEVGSSWFI